MGNQQSSGKKDKGDKGDKIPTDLPLERESYRSFDRSDTKESSRSIRNSIRSKIPGSGKPESPKNSVAILDIDTSPNGAADKSDPALARSASKGGIGSRRGSSASAQLAGIESAAKADALPESPQPPPSPVHGPLGSGHTSVSKAQQSGEVDHVSDQPPTGVRQPSSTQQPGESILQKKDQPIPRIPDVPSTTDGSGSPMEISALKTMDLDDMIQRLLDAAYTGKVTKTVCLKNAEIFAVCSAAREVFLSQPALLELSSPVKIVGDIHGQYTDLIRMFEMCGFPPNSNYLFLGDYVDRGKQSLETILLLMCYKLKFPENFFLLRGNHECANVTRVYGFYDECKRRCNIKVWKAFVDTFNTLPIAAIVAQKIFCVHGGLSPSLSHMDDIRQIARPTDVPDYGLLNDLLWSDPADMENDWESNERGVSYCFGKKVIMEFLQRHDFDLVCRAHMVVEDGYEFFNDRILVTVFSAPNYCGEFDNWGAVMSVSGELLCSFELLKPLDSSALKTHIKKSRTKRQSMLNSPGSGNEAGSLMIARTPQEMEHRQLRERYKLAEGPEQQHLHMRNSKRFLRRSSGSEDMRLLKDSTASIPPAAQTPTSTDNTEAIAEHILDAAEIASSDGSSETSNWRYEHQEQDSKLRQMQVAANRSLWESALPPAITKLPDVDPNMKFTYIDEGESSKRKLLSIQEKEMERKKKDLIELAKKPFK